MAIARPAADVVAAFERDLAAMGAAEGPLAVAVSGGPDSLALLLLTAAARRETVRAATVDHGLRTGSDGEAAFVGRVCAELGVPHETLPVRVARRGQGLQGDARRARYAALAGWMDRHAVATLLTAHHADDQAETLMMRLQRGSGVGGLAGVRPRAVLPGSNGRLAVARPLLRWRREALAEIVVAAGLTPVDDPSNANPEFDRVRMRRQIAATPWLDVQALARSAAALAEADAALDAMAAQVFERNSSLERGGIALAATGLPAEMRRRLVLRCLRGVQPQAAPRGDQLTALLASLERGQTTTLAGVMCTGGETWRFRPAPSRR